jgi:hypothetical protein
MADETTPEGGHTANPEVSCEPRDVRLKPILVVLATALVAGVVIHAAVWLFFDGYRSRQDRAKASTFPLADVSSDALPKGPRLEQVKRLPPPSGKGSTPSPEANKEDEQPSRQVRDGYGKTDEAGFVRVPIERAMDHLAGKLPSRPEPDADEQRRGGGLVASGESNSGRVFRKGGR